MFGSPQPAGPEGGEVNDWVIRWLSTGLGCYLMCAAFRWKEVDFNIAGFLRGIILGIIFWPIALVVIFIQESP